MPRHKMSQLSCTLWPRLDGVTSPLPSFNLLDPCQKLGQLRTAVSHPGQGSPPSDWTPGVPWAAGPIGMLTLQPAPTLSQVVISGEKAAGAQTPSLAVGRLTHAPSLTPSQSSSASSPPLSVFLDSLERPAGAGRLTYCPQRCLAGREALAGSWGRAAVTSCGCLGVMVKGNPPPHRCQRHSLPESGLWSSSSKAM